MSMRKGDLVAGYVLKTDAQSGGGHSEWAIAERDGEDFFIKRFLQPTYPLTDGPGSPQTKAAKRARCEAFERHQRLVMRRLRPISGESGNLVITRDFFREHAFYYKVTTKVDVSGIGPMGIATMRRDDRILIMLTAAKSLDTLHKAGLVHGDVKPDNLLIKALDRGYAVKVIDFDNCFPVHHPPAPDQLVGDPAYYSPELLLYNLDKAAGEELDGKNDVFALGLVFWLYLTGARPPLPDGVVYPAEAVQAGTALTMPRAVQDPPLADLVNSMLAKAPGIRPSMNEVHSALKLARRSVPDFEPDHSASSELERYGRKGVISPLFPRLARPKSSSPAPPAILEEALVAKMTSAEALTPDRPVTDEEGKLKGTLLKKKAARRAEEEGPIE